MRNSKLTKKQRNNEELALDIVTMAQIHIKYITFANLVNSAHRVVEKGDGNIAKHINNCALLVGLSWIEEYAAIGYECGYFEPGQMVYINEAIKIVLKELRPQLIPVVEMFRFDDNVLCSAIGNSYGDIYEQHLECAKSSRLNKTKGAIPDGYMEHIMPML